MTCGLAAFTLCASASAITADPTGSRFSGIAERNVFGLKAAPVQEDVQPPAAVPKLILTGITSMFGQKRVLLRAQPPAAAGTQPKEESFILSEGQREGPVEVLAIDPNASSVLVNNSGTVMTLTFEKNGAKSAGTSAPPAPPTLPGGIPAPSQGNPYPGRHVLPTRTPRLPVNPATGASIGAMPAPTGTTPGTAADAAAIAGEATPPIPAAPGEPPADQALEQQLLQLEAQRQAAQAAQGGGSLPPIPGMQAPPTAAPGASRFQSPQLAPQ
jgi:hypothetical protein